MRWGRILSTYLAGALLAGACSEEPDQGQQPARPSPSTAAAEAPMPSGEGRVPLSGRIAFDDFDDVWTIDADGTDLTRLTHSPWPEFDPAWSPDGSQIVFTSQRDNGDREIYVMNADGSGQTRLTTSPGFDENPSWSPDGERIAFDSMRDGNLEIYVMNADGTKQTRVTNHPALDAIPSWSQDSKRIVFVSDRNAKAQRRLFVMNADGTNVRMLTRGALDMSPDWARG